MQIIRQGDTGKPEDYPASPPTRQDEGDKDQTCRR